MSVVADLQALGAHVEDPVSVARFLTMAVMARPQKAALFRTYLSERGLELTPELVVAARAFESAL